MIWKWAYNISNACCTCFLQDSFVSTKWAFFPFWFINSLHKNEPTWIYPNNKYIIFNILNRIDHKWDILPCTLQDIKNKRIIIKHIQIIILARKTKMCMPKPQTLVCNYFKDNAIILIFVTKSTLPTEWETFSNVVHAI